MIPRRLPRLLMTCCLAASLLLGGCATKYQEGPPPGFAVPEPVPPAAVPFYQKLGREGERNWVLNLNQMGVESLRSGNRDFAERAFTESLIVIDADMADDPVGNTAASPFGAEKQKLFKGEPHERAMAYFYRGVLAMMNQEWDTARAAFRGAQLQDAYAESAESRGDWVIFNYLIGVCEQRMGSATNATEMFRFANEDFQQYLANFRGLSAYQTRPLPTLLPPPETALPPFPPEHNLLVIAQHGSGPRKVGLGKYEQKLAYAPGYQTWGISEVLVDGKSVGNPMVTDSLFYQAVTRGGREFDRNLSRQATLKDATHTAGVVGVAGGLIVLDQGFENDSSDTQLAGLAVLGLGASSLLTSIATRPQADLRNWSSLPDGIGFLHLNVPPGRHDLGIRYGGQTIMKSVNVPEPKEGLAVVLAFPPPRPFAVVGGPGNRSAPAPVPPVTASVPSVEKGDDSTTPLMSAIPPSPREEKP